MWTLLYSFGPQSERHHAVSMDLECMLAPTDSTDMYLLVTENDYKNFETESLRSE